MKNIPITENRINIRNEVIEILKTMMELQKPFGLGYISQILLGKSSFGWKDEAHTSLPTFASLDTESKERIHKMYHFLIKRGFIEMVKPDYNTAEITEDGIDFTHYPHDIWVNNSVLRSKPFDKKLYVLLKKLRVDISRKESVYPYEVFNDHTLDCLVAAKPENVLQLKNIPGLTDYKVDTFGHLILKEVHFILHQQEKERKLKNIKKANYQSLKRIKALFHAGYSIEEIANNCEIKPSTVRGYLFVLHDAEEINLIPWIEKNIPADSLRVGTQYFKEVDRPRLKEAYEVLGLDYETLRFCRLYVSQISSEEDELLLP